MALNKRAVRGVNSGVRHLAVGCQQRQQVDEAVAPAAEPGPQHFRLLFAVPASDLDGAAEGDGPMAGNRRPLLSLGQAVAMGRSDAMGQFGGVGPWGFSGQTGQRADQEQDCKAGEDWHGASDNGAPVNAA